MALAALVLGVSQPAAANGRFPRAQRLMQEPGEPAHLAIYGTYGLLLTSDAGQTWQHVCEAATGPFAGEAPLLELLPQGRVVLSSETGLRSGVWPACQWRGLLEPRLPETVQDITLDRASENGLWALLNQPDVSVGFRAAVARSKDGGETWSEARRLPTEVIGQGLTVDVAPSRPERVYVSGLDAAKSGVLGRSDDAGDTWQAFAIQGTDASEVPYLAAVDALDENRIFIRTDVLREHEGQLQPDDALLYSADGGASFTRVLSRRAKLLGFALSPGGETLLLGYGDPVLFAYTVEPEQTGLYRLRVADLQAEPATAASKLTKIFSGSVTCLRWTAHGLYACLAQAERGFEAGRAADAEFSLETEQPFTPLLDLKSLTPQACPAASSAGMCLSEPNKGWPAVCDKLGADCSPKPSGAASPAATQSSAGGCACQVPAESPAFHSNLPTFLGLAGLWRRFRRQRRLRPDINAG